MAWLTDDNGRGGGYTTMTDEPKISVTCEELMQIISHCRDGQPFPPDFAERMRGLFSLLARTYAAPVRRGRKPKAVGNGQ